jgi:hypothetical protein
MDYRASTQLEKILALADSTHDGEAIMAVRKARQIMLREGLSFGDLARVASGNLTRSKPFSFFSVSHVHFEAQLVLLRQELCEVQDELQTQSAETQFWRQRAAELERLLAQRQSEVQRWQQLARATLEKLLRLGQPVNIEISQQKGLLGAE